MEIKIVSDEDIIEFYRKHPDTSPFHNDPGVPGGLGYDYSYGATDTSSESDIGSAGPSSGHFDEGADDLFEDSDGDQSDEELLSLSELAGG